MAAPGRLAAPEEPGLPRVGLPRSASENRGTRSQFHTHSTDFRVVVYSVVRQIISALSSRSCRECWNERFFSPVPQIFNTSAGKAFVLLSYVFLSLVIHNLRHTGAPCDSSPYHDSAGLKYSVFAVLATWCSARRRVKLRTRCRVKRKWESTSWAPRRQLCLPLPSWHSH